MVGPPDCRLKPRLKLKYYPQTITPQRQSLSYYKIKVRFPKKIVYPRSPKGEEGLLFYLCPSVLPSIRPRYFRRIFLSNCWWQKSDIWSQASYRYTILWVAFLDPSDSYFLFADLVGFYTHWTHFSSHFSQQLLMAEIWYLVTSFIYGGKRFWTHQILTSCLPILLIFIHI